MRIFLVTIKLPKNPAHDPRNKVADQCPAVGTRVLMCTDSTGEHHTVPVEARDAVQAICNPAFEDKHITRVEGPFVL